MKQTNLSPSRRVAVTGILCALAAGVSVLEGFLPSLPVPGAKPGLSNIVTMAALSGPGFPAAVSVTLVKGGFALMRGGTACILSLSGGVISTLIMAALYRLPRRHISFIGLGIAGAAAHNTAQLAAASVLTGQSLWLLAPWLLAAGLAAGIITGLAMNLLELSGIHRRKQETGLKRQ